MMIGVCCWRRGSSVGALALDSDCLPQRPPARLPTGVARVQHQRRAMLIALVAVARREKAFLVRNPRATDRISAAHRPAMGTLEVFRE